MPTYEELRRESVYNAMTIPIELGYLARNLRNFWELQPQAVGMFPDRFHTSGYHMSRNWLRSSQFAQRRGYSTTETPGNRAGGNGNAISAMDITLPRGLLLVTCRRLDVAVRAGLLEKVTEWYGNIGGDNRVDGYDNIVNRVESSDPSHLWHLHMSFDRGLVEENHGDLFRILTTGATTPTGPTPPIPGTGNPGWTDIMISTAPLVTAGQTGPWVRTVQGLCQARGEAIAVDGDFRGQTERAVKAIQQRAGLALVEGMVGPQTWPVLFPGKREG